MSMTNRYPPALDHHHHQQQQQHDDSCYASMSCCYSSSCSSSTNVFAQMGSLSINPTSSLETDQTYMHCPKIPDDHNKISCWGHPLMGNNNTTADDVQHHQQQNNAATTTEEEGENTNEGSFGERDQSSVNIDCGQSKLCARGHWRPAEDSKLKELVALYGPQNWNLIAEKLEGRSGTHHILFPSFQ